MNLLDLDRLAEDHVRLKSFSVVPHMEGYVLVEHGINESYIWHCGQRWGMFLRAPSWERGVYWCGSENEAWGQLSEELLRLRRNEPA